MSLNWWVGGTAVCTLVVVVLARSLYRSLKQRNCWYDES